MGCAVQNGPVQRTPSSLPEGAVQRYTVYPTQSAQVVRHGVVCGTHFDPSSSCANKRKTRCGTALAAGGTGLADVSEGLRRSQVARPITTPSPTTGDDHTASPPRTSRNKLVRSKVSERRKGTTWRHPFKHAQQSRCTSVAHTWFILRVSVASKSLLGSQEVRFFVFPWRNFPGTRDSRYFFVRAPTDLNSSKLLLLKVLPALGHFVQRISQLSHISLPLSCSSSAPLFCVFLEEAEAYWKIPGTFRTRRWTEPQIPSVCCVSVRARGCVQKPEQERQLPARFTTFLISLDFQVQDIVLVGRPQVAPKSFLLEFRSDLLRSGCSCHW